MGLVRFLKRFLCCCVTPDDRGDQVEKNWLDGPVPIAYHLFWPDITDDGYVVNCLRGSEDEWSDVGSYTDPMYNILLAGSYLKYLRKARRRDKMRQGEVWRRLTRRVNRRKRRAVPVYISGFQPIGAGDLSRSHSECNISGPQPIGAGGLRRSHSECEVASVPEEAA